MRHTLTIELVKLLKKRLLIDNFNLFDCLKVIKSINEFKKRANGLFFILSKAFLIFCFVIISKYNLTAATSIEPADTTLPRGGVHPFYVYGSIGEHISGTIAMNLVFNAFVIDIKGFADCPQCIITAPQFSFNMIKLDSAVVLINGEIAQNHESGLLCILEIEGLVGPDTITAVIPTELKINGIGQADAIFRNGKIRVLSDQIVQKLPEGLGSGYPNPFAGSISIPIMIAEETTVEFFIYNSFGRLVYTYPENGEKDFALYSDAGMAIPWSKELILSKGKYRLQFNPEIEFTATGAYYILMKTQKGKYSAGFMIAR